MAGGSSSVPEITVIPLRNASIMLLFFLYYIFQETQEWHIAAMKTIIGEISHFTCASQINVTFIQACFHPTLK